ncbi:MAG: YfhO family protein, partial [Oscillospiraceae bacterium]|nr:YfhO family protein [Oscillospiraceae bacterium]
MQGSSTGGLQKVQAWFYRNRAYFAAFFIPVILLYIAYAFFGLTPYGDHSVLCLDLNGQYVYYFEAIRDAFHGNGSILYNWSRNLSGGYQGVIGYYLASPFTLIVILLPRKWILASLFIMILCKLGAASVTMTYFLRKARHVETFTSVILGTMFGMCAYGVIQTIDPMWLDGLIALRLIALGIEYLVDDGRKLNFIIPLAYICIANFYIGFMCCIFTAIYFVI